jgi:anti-sigma factor RsiW
VNGLPVTEAELHALVDGVLSEARRIEVEAYLATHAEDAQRVKAWRQQKEALHLSFDPIMTESTPRRLRTSAAGRRRFQSLVRHAAVVGWLAVGGAGGWYLHGYTNEKSADTIAFAHRAAIAHVVYSPEVRHPVEVGADQEAHLVAWLSKRLGGSLKLPQLGAVGYHLVGGRLLPGNQGPVAQFMFEDGSGQRLTLYVRNGSADGKETAFRYAQERGISVFYWVDRRFGYAISGEIAKADLLRVANVVYQQLNP